MRRLTSSLLGMAVALGAAIASDAPRRRRAQVAKAPKSNHAEIATWNQAVERRNSAKRAKKLGHKARKNQPLED